MHIVLHINSYPLSIQIYIKKKKLVHGSKTITCIFNSFTKTELHLKTY